MNAIGLLTALFFVVGSLTAARTVLLVLWTGPAARHRRRRAGAGHRPAPPAAPPTAPVTEPVTVIVPAPEDGPNLSGAVRSLASGEHEGGIEVLVVGPVAAWELPNVRVIDAPDGGRAAALAAGVTAATSDLLVVAGPDTVVEPDSIRRLVQPFADPAVGAVAGNVRVGNGGTRLTRWQQVDYVTGANVDRRLYGALRCLPTVPEAFGAYRRTALRDAGGFRENSLADDTDATMALIRAGWRVVYEGGARAWVEAPATLSELWRERYGRTRGAIRAAARHGRSMVDRLPYLAVFGVALPVLAPLVDVLALYGVLFGDRLASAAIWVALAGVQALAGVVAFRLDREHVATPWALPVQQLAFRHLTSSVLLHAAVAAALTRRAGRGTSVRPLVSKT